MKNDFKIKNYTTSIAVEKTLMEIEQLLVSFGASLIMKDISPDGRTKALSFKLQDKGYKLPANADGVKMILTPKGSRTRTPMLEQDRQADRVAWRIVKDWLHAQLSLIASGQAVPEQILLPYQYNGKRTLYEIYKEGRLALPEGD